MTAVTPSGSAAPQRIAVVGAGMVGLATAWFLQERGVEVTVIDREGVAAGSSWGNAGWLTPGITTPLPEPAVLKYGIRAVLSPNSPVYVPPSRSRSKLWSDRSLTGTSEPIALFHAFIVLLRVKPVTNFRKSGLALGGT